MSATSSLETAEAPHVNFDLENLVTDMKSCIGVMRHLMHSPCTVSDVQWSIPIDRADEIADQLQAAFDAMWQAECDSRKEYKAEVAKLKAEKAAPGSEDDRLRVEASRDLLLAAAMVVVRQFRSSKKLAGAPPTDEAAKGFGA
jgi:hypothetical protein